MPVQLRLALLLGLLLPSIAMAEQFMFVCHLVPNAPEFPPIDANYLVDTDKGTVNNVPATIGDTEIYWAQTGPSGTTYKTKINRLTGKALVMTDLPLMSGVCQKMTQRTF
jgi:hypothetical protein